MQDLDLRQQRFVGLPLFDGRSLDNVVEAGSVQHESVALRLGRYGGCPRRVVQQGQLPKKLARLIGLA